jgi:hypothetical protein
MITNKNINSIDKKTYKDFLNKINNIAA